MLDKYITWFKAHERLLLVALVLGVGLYGFNHWLDKSAMDAETKAAVAEQVAAEQKSANAQLAAQIQQQTLLFQQAEMQREKEMASLVEAIASREAASAKQVAQVSGLKTPPQAVSDLNAAYPTLPTPLVPTDFGASVPTADLQVFTVTKIEGDTAKADLADTRTELKDSQDSVTQAVSLLKGKDDQISGLNVSLDKNAKACEADKKDLKDQARKHSWRWFWAGVVAGFTGRGLLKL